MHLVSRHFTVLTEFLPSHLIVEDVVYVKPHLLANSVNSCDANYGPLSVIKVSDTPYILQIKSSWPLLEHCI